MLCKQFWGAKVATPKIHKLLMTLVFDESDFPALGSQFEKDHRDLVFQGNVAFCPRKNFSQPALVDIGCQLDERPSKIAMSWRKSAPSRVSFLAHIAVWRTFPQNFTNTQSNKNITNSMLQKITLFGTSFARFTGSVPIYPGAIQPGRTNSTSRFQPLSFEKTSK